jgi:hypothetical protein
MYIGKRIDGIKVSKEMALAVGMYVDKIHALSESVGHEPLIEVRFTLEKLGPPVDMFGTADCVIPDREHSHLHVLDYKHGQGVVVEATDNPQLQYYALGAVLHLEERFDTITVWIIQPRAPHRDGVVRDWTFTWDELVAFRQRLLEGAKETMEPNAPLAVGSWCRFCPASALCPAQKDHALTVVQDAFMEAQPPTLPHPTTLSEQELDYVLSQREHVTNWLNAVEKFVRGQKEEGRVTVENWKLVHKRANRKWTLPDQEVAELLLERGIDRDDLYKQSIISPAQAERLLRREGEDIPEGLTDRTPSGYNLVPADDPRPAADITVAAEVFNADSQAESNN